MISLTEARQLIASNIAPRPAVAVDLDGALGCVLAEPVLSDSLYPSGDRSQMDGYVVRGDAVPGRFRLAGEIQAGMVPDQVLEPGDCCRIFTGALLPPGGGRVVMQEDTIAAGDFVRMERFGQRLFIREKGSEARPGQVLLPAGTRLGAVELAVLAQVGMVRPVVIPAPTVFHVATGDELVDPAVLPGAGGIRDTNTSLLRALLSERGVTRFSSRRTGDDPAAMAAAAETDDDLLLLSGGASVGEYDFGAVTLARLGWTIHFNRVNLRPGKPLTFATRGSQAAFVIPGNPVSHFVCYHTAIRLAVECAAGRPIEWPAVWLDLADGCALEQDPRETWWPATAVARDGRLTVSPKSWSSSGNSFSLAGTNALVQVNAQSPRGGKALTLLLEPPAS